MDINTACVKIKKLYAYYDQPVLFLAEQDDQLYLAVYVDHSETEDIFLYAPVSPDRVADIEGGKLDLHSAFKRVEGGFVYRVSVAIYKPQSRTEMIACENLDVEDLPLPGAYLNN